MTAEPETQEEMTGLQLIQSWRHNGHQRSRSCPTCLGAVLTIGVTKIVYVFEVCKCGNPDFDHLVEVLYHRSCLEATRCGSYLPWPPRRNITPHDDCQRCGRPESAHTETDQAMWRYCDVEGNPIADNPKVRAHLEASGSFDAVDRLLAEDAAGISRDFITAEELNTLIDETGSR